MNALDRIAVLVAQVGPTELLVPESRVVESAGLGGWVLWIAGVGLITIAWVWMRTIQHKRVDARELAFRSLCKRMGLSNEQVRAIRELSKAQGAHPVGLLICPSAIRAAGAR